MSWPCAAVFRLSSPLVAHSANAWPFAVATATQFHRFKRSRLTGIGAPSPPSGSDHSTATEEPAQSATLPPTSPHAIVWCGDTPVLQSPDDRRERGKRKPRLGPMSASQPPKLHQSEPRDPQHARGVPAQNDGRSAASTVFHETPKNVTILATFSGHFRARARAGNSAFWAYLR